MKTTVSSKGQIVLPVALREQDRIGAGQEFSIERLNSGEYLLKRIPVGGSAGIADWLQNCPGREWFQPIESELTDTL